MAAVYRIPIPALRPHDATAARDFERTLGVDHPHRGGVACDGFDREAEAPAVSLLASPFAERKVGFTALKERRKSLGRRAKFCARGPTVWVEHDSGELRMLHRLGFRPRSDRGAPNMC